jgi:hypothetical protein
VSNRDPFDDRARSNAPGEITGPQEARPHDVLADDVLAGDVLGGEARPVDGVLDPLLEDGLFHDGPFEQGLDADELAEQRAVRALLSSLPDPGPVPPDVLDRITRTLRALDHERTRQGSWPRAAGDEGPVGATAASVARLPRRTTSRVLWLAAAAAVVLGGGGAVVSRLASDSSASQSAASASASARPDASAAAGRGQPTAAEAPPVYATGRSYRGTDLVRQAQALLQPGRPVAGGTAPRALAAPQRGVVAGCLRAVGAAPTDLLAADLGTYEGRPAVVLVIRTGQGREVRVTARDCHTGMAPLTTAALP